LHFTQATHCPNKATSLVLAAQPTENFKTDSRLTLSARAATASQLTSLRPKAAKCRDLLAESPDKGNAKTQTKPHVQI
jgi:hypothetical protein